MQKKIARKIASITAVSLASGLITVPAGANADLTPNLQIMQKTEIISDEALDQSYQYDYQSDGNDQKFTQVETSWDNAFVAKKLVVGDWKNYDGDVVVSILKDDGMEYQLQTTENAQVELSDYGEISSIKLQPAGEIANSDASMSGMVIDGDIDMSQASDTVELKGTIRESEDGENFTSKVDETVSATVLKTSYKIETPVWKTEQDKLSYGQTAKVTLDGLAGTGTAELSSYECQLIIPKGTEIEQIDPPEFEHATSTLFVDGKEYTEGIITSDSKVLLQICLEKDNNSLIEDDNSQDEDNNSPAYDFKQTKSLSLLLKNIQQDAKSEDVLIQAYVKAVYGDDQEVKTEASQKIQLICEYQMESPKVSSSATIIPGQDDVQLTFNNMNATATTSVTGYVVDFYIPSDLTVETIRVPEFVDSEGNSVERLITINGQHPSILNKTIFLYDKIGSFQMVVYTKDGTFSQSRDMVITASNQTSSEKEIEIKAVANGYYANNLVQTVESNIQKLTLQKVVTPPAPTPEPTIEPTVTPEPEPEPTQTPTQAPEPSPNPTTTPIPTPTITPEPTTVPSESDSVKKEAANLKPLTPNVSVSNTTSGDTLKAEKKQETNDIVDKLRPTAATAVQETAVTDDFSNKQTSEKTESSSANAARVTTAPVEKIEKTSPEKVKDAVEETVNENRGIQVLLILLVIIGCGIAVLTGMFLHFTRKKKHLLHLEEKMNDSKNVKGDS